MTGKRRIIDDDLYAHFVTFSVYRRRRLLDHDHAKRIVLGVLNLVLERTGSRCVGFVLMPDHVHAVIWLKKLEERLTYMHMNPVRQGLVERATDWKWSSARWYEWGRTVGVPISWVP